jgi:hypothetical protein
MIKGLQPQLAEAGKIKIGGLGAERTAKSGRKWRAPEKYDCFVVTTTRRDETGSLIVDDALMRILPRCADGRVREIPIVLHSDDIEAVFPTAYACYAGRRLKCRGDGEKALEWDANRTTQTERACPCDRLRAPSGDICKPHGTLHCSLMIPGHATAGAVYKWRTTSIISIQRMIGSLQQIMATVGVLRGIPLRLKVEPVQVSPNDKATTVYCCHVELKAADITQVQQDAMAAAEARRALANGLDIDAQYKRLVAAPGVGETPEEEREIAEEFHSDGTAPEVGEQNSVTARLTQKLAGR